MRVTFFIVMILASLQGYSQKNFEGSIKYMSHSTSGDSIGRCEIIFGKTKMKTSWWTSSKPGEERLREYQVYDFDKAVLYVVFPQKELIKVDSFPGGSDGQSADLEKTTEKRVILGHSCSEYLDTKVDFMKTRIWQCDDLYYIIPEKYRNRHTLSASEAGNILFLGLELKFDFGELMGQDAKEQSTRIEATEIQPYAVPDSVFSIPASYKIVFEEISVDEVTLEEIKIEEEEAPPPPPPPPPKPQKSKNRKQ